MVKVEAMTAEDYREIESGALQPKVKPLMKAAAIEELHSQSQRNLKLIERIQPEFEAEKEKLRKSYVGEKLVEKIDGLKREYQGQIDTALLKVERNSRIAEASKPFWGPVAVLLKEKFTDDSAADAIAKSAAIERFTNAPLHILNLSLELAIETEDMPTAAVIYEAFEQRRTFTASDYRRIEREAFRKARKGLLGLAENQSSEITKMLDETIVAAGAARIATGKTPGSYAKIKQGLKRAGIA